MSTPYEEGEAAYHSGARNRYPTGSWEYDEWYEGWADARDDDDDDYWDDDGDDD
jgi:hypothetical protein